MTNFNDKINSETGFILFDQDRKYFIFRTDSARGFGRIVEDYLYCRKSAYRLFIQYKDTHRVKRVAGHCFMWACASKTSDRVEVRRLDCDSNEDFSYSGDPVFNSIAGAIFISDRYVYVYGDTWLEAVDLEKKHVVCNAYVCRRLVSNFKIPAQVFDRLFGIEENFPRRCMKNAEAKPVQSECVEVSFADSDQRSETKTTTLMKENETKDNQEKLTDACDAPNLDKDHERVIIIREAEIRSLSSGEIHLFNAFVAKDDAEQFLATECERAHKLVSDGESEDEREELMKELIMIIVKRYRGAISAQTLNQFLCNCSEYPQALASLIARGMLKCATHTDGSPACFYVPTICNKNCHSNDRIN